MIAAGSEMQADKRMARRIRRAYVLALSIIALATISAFLVENAMAKRFEDSSSVLNAVSKQRTLSQTIVLFASDVLSAPDHTIRQMAMNNLSLTFGRMTAAHGDLLERMDVDGARAGALTPETRGIFFDKPHALNARFLRYEGKVRAFLKSDVDTEKARYTALYFEAIGPLATTLDAALRQLEKDAMHDVAMMRRIRVAMTVIVILTLAGEWLFIFRPLALTVERKTRALEQTRDALAHAALHDALTGLPNRRMLDEIVGTTVMQARRMGKTLTICHVDLDRFKAVNDTLGHSVGDKVLIHAAGVLNAATRESDFIARVGGDEFVIVDCTFGGEPGAMVMAERIVERMARPFEVDGHVCRIGASIGIAICDPATGDIEEAFARADIALYHAKEEGRGQARIYSRIAQDAFESRIAKAVA